MSVNPDGESLAPLSIDMSLRARWLDGGMASLDVHGHVIESNTALSSWLRSNHSGCVGKSLVLILSERYPEWGQALTAFFRTASTFGQLLLPAVNTEPKQWYTLESARHAEGWIVRLSSSLPPLSELEEGTWDQYMNGEAAQRSMFIRLLRAESQLDNLVHRWPGVIFSQRADFSFHFVSPQILQLTGIPAHEWRTQPNLFWEAVHESDVEELKQQIKQANRTSEGVTVSFRVKNLKTGRVAYILEHRQAVVTNSNLVLGYEGVWLDITRQTIAERRLSTAAWKETLAVLTMGLAHDFSNVMAGIHSLSESFLAQVDSLHPFHEGLTLIKQNSLQASQLVQRIINLHHGKTGERNYCDLNEIIRDLVELGRKIIPRRIEVKVELSNDPLPLYVDFVEFRQVIINLALNAADAMPQRGELVFRTSQHGDLPALDHFQGQLPRLPSVCLTVKDNGCGIEARHMASIFDPFFTTKPMEKGSGLGLYNARLFIEKHHGAISVDSVEGVGTTFRIWLPLSDFTEGEREEDMSSGVRRSLLLAGSRGKSIETTAEFLRLNGYQAVLAHSEAHALEILRSDKYRFAGLMILLEMNQEEFISLLKNPQLQEQSLKVILRIVGCNQDELDIEHLRRADLIIPPESSQEKILRELESLFKIKEERGNE